MTRGEKRSLLRMTRRRRELSFMFKVLKPSGLTGDLSLFKTRTASACGSIEENGHSAGAARSPVGGLQTEGDEHGADVSPSGRALTAQTPPCVCACPGSQEAPFAGVTRGGPAGLLSGGCVRSPPLRSQRSWALLL